MEMIYHYAQNYRSENKNALLPRLFFMRNYLK